VKKLLFCYSYDYLSVPHYKEIVKLIPTKFESDWLWLSCDAPTTGISHPGKELTVRLFKRKNNPLFFLKIVNYVYKVINYLRLNSILKESKPDLVFLSSDVLPEEMRFMYALCKAKKIPTIIYWPAEFDYVPLKIWGKRLSRKRTNYGFWEMFIYACRFKSGTVGSFRLDSKLYVYTHNIKDKLEKAGVQSSGINAVGMPYTPVYSEEGINRLSKIMSGYDKRIVLFTEVIERLKGEEYLRVLYRTINNIFERCGNKACLAVRFHPREYEKIKSFTREQLYAGNVFFLEEDLTLDDICAVSDLSIAHHSKALLLAVLIGTRILSIDIDDDPNSFLETEEKALKISSLEELAKKLEDFIFYGLYESEAETALDKLKQRYAFRPEIVIKDIEQYLKG